MPLLYVLKVFVGEDGAGGNLLGVFPDGGGIPEGSRQKLAFDLGFSETVFVDDARSGELRVFTPASELPFAGHPLVGAAWLLEREGFAADVLRPPAGEVPVRREGDLTFISGSPEWAPAFEHFRYGSPQEVEALGGPPEGYDLVGAWAWEDEEEGVVRCRVFAPGIGVSEDEATGSHAVRLAAKLGRRLIIRQGVGSVVLAEPRAGGMVEVGGKVRPVEEREYGGVEK